MPVEDSSEITVPESFDALTDDELVALDTALTERFQALYGAEGGLTTEQLAELAAIQADVMRVRAEAASRAEVAANNQAEADRLAAEVLGTATEPEPEPTPEEEPPAEPAPEPPAEPAPEPEAEPEAIAAAALPAQPRRYPRLNVPLSEIRSRAPKVDAPAPQRQATVTASADVPGFSFHGVLPNLEALGHALHSRAKGMPTTNVGPEGANYVEVARIENMFDVTVDGERTSEAEMGEVLTDLTKPQALVAGGGWCAPSETRYEFFNVACEDGLLDLPTFGVRRGGIRFPTSPTLSDVYTGAFDNTTNPWLWTEADDIATVTGGPNKPCVRVPCPSFVDRRLECYGICLTAGNLTDAAYPEATANQLRLLNSAMVHASNARYIAQIIALPNVTGGTLGTAGSGVAAPLLGSVELASIDMKTRLGMCDTDVLEVILPVWARGTIRSDLAKRSGVDLLAVSDARIADFFDVRSIRVQYVQDWQTRGAGQIGAATPSLLWPTTVNFLIYPAGAVARGNGFDLRLGVVRDSTLNAENDHTAMWMEECHLIAQFGPTPRQYTVNICTDGTVGAADLTACGV